MGIALAFGISGAIVSSNNASAQSITTDTTLNPSPQTLIKVNDGQRDVYTIPQALGQTVGNNLFHSFREFSLPNGERADFKSDSSIRNILSRVTGGSPSLINGEIYTSSPNVNLFLINPYGIIFGPNASLEVGSRTGRGAFVATTVDALVWPNGSQFSATNPGGPSSLLTIVGDPGGFLSSSRTPGPISNLGGKLEVYDNQSLLFVGGNTTLDGGELKAQGGRVEMVAVGGAGRVDLDLNSTDKALTFNDDLVRADVLLTNKAQINATTGQNNGTGSGLIRILGRNISITNGAKLDTSTFGSPDAGIVAFNASDSLVISGKDTVVFSQVTSGATGNAQGIGIKAKSFYLLDGAQLTTSTFGQGNSGVVLVEADQAVLDNSAIFSTVESGAQGDALGIKITAGSIILNNDAELQTLTRGLGDAGVIILETNGGAVALNNGRIFSTVETGGEGKGGGISIETGTLSLSNGGQLQTLVRSGGKGDAGVIYVNATGSIDLRGISPTNGKPSGIFSTINEGAEGGIGSSQFAGGIFRSLLTGRADNLVGAIFLETGSLSLTDGAVITTNTAGEGNAGAIVVLARDKVSLTNGGGIGSAVETNGQGDGGAILMSAGELSIEGTADRRSGITTETNGQGDAGLIYVETDRDIKVKGDRNGFFSTVEAGGIGTSGAIFLNTRSLTLRDGAEVSVNNQEFGEAGSIFISAKEHIFLLNRAKITATTLSGNGGNIYLEAGDFLVLLRNSDISTTAGNPSNPTAGTGGNGGSIYINQGIQRARGVWGIPVNNSDITAQADVNNRGGKIRVNSGRLYSIARRVASPNTNDINASGGFELIGDVQTNEVDIDPTQGLINLPETPIDPSRLIAQACPARARGSATEVNKFTVPGRGGLEPSPNDTLQNNSVETDFITPNPPRENRKGNDSSSNPSGSVSSESQVSKTPQLVEAQTRNGSSSNPSDSASSEHPVQKTAPLVEAQGWVYGANGEVILTAQANTATPQSPSLTPAAAPCNAY
jgi:filamentous hemagglutinin family protein